MIDWSKVITAEDKASAAVEATAAGIRARRDLEINRGISVAGVQIQTDEKSQARIMGAALSALLDPDYTLDWHAADGSILTLTGQQVIGIAQAVRAHVQACFDRTAVLLAELSAGGSADPDTGWP